MTNKPTVGHLLGRFATADGTGVLQLEDRYDTPIEDLWAAITEPERLARWHGELEGDLRPGGEYRLYIPAIELALTGRIEVCDPPRRLVVTSRETVDSFEQGQGAAPFDEWMQATLSADGEQTVLSLEVRGLPLDKIAFYGAGWQINGENLAAFLAGVPAPDIEARWAELVPPYQQLAAEIG